MTNEYNGSLTREQFLFFETRIVAKLICDGMDRDSILKKIKEENLFQFPTERMTASILTTCLKRIDALDSEALVTNSIFSLDFYQKEAVSGKITAADYEIYMADGAGTPVSDKKSIIADKTSANGSERVFRTRFTLKSVEFKKTDTYYLTVTDKETGKVTDRIEFTIDIAFVNDFDF